MKKTIDRLHNAEERHKYFLEDKDLKECCRFYIGPMRLYVGYFSKVLILNLKKIGFNLNNTKFAYLDDFHPNGRGDEALKKSRAGNGTKVLKEVISDCINNEAKIIFCFASTESSRSFFLKKQGWTQDYPPKKHLFYKLIN